MSAPPEKISQPTKRSPFDPETQEDMRTRVNLRQNASRRLQKRRTPTQPFPWIMRRAEARGREGFPLPVPICHPIIICAMADIIVNGPSENGWTNGTASNNAAKQKLDRPRRSSISPSSIPSVEA